jgi:DNA ligase D-like protein (predicted 3'-phosphoesterase)
MSTKDYRSNRNFDNTGEPRGSSGHKSSKPPRFVIQKHDASTLHYDFRIEADGVLKSWAVPKGPSTDPGEKRLAIPTEDHPLEYADFEGVIPEDEYGGGTVLVWDHGPYENITEKDGEIQPVVKAIEAGHVLIELRGEKLQGGFALHRTGSGDDARWLLIKMDDEHADARRNPVSTEQKSVKSGRTMKQVADEEGEDDE